MEIAFIFSEYHMSNVINVPNIPVPRASSTGQLSNPLSQPAKGTRFAAAAPLITTAIGTAVSASQNASNNKRAQQNALQERIWQLEDRAHYEEYYRPANQMARLRAAGINPLLASQSISGGESMQLSAQGPENVPQNDVGSMISSASGPLMESAQMEQNYDLAQQQMSQERDLKGKELEIQGEQIEVAKKRNDIAKDQLDIDKERAKYENNLNDALARKADAEANNARQQYRILFNEANTWQEQYNLRKRIQELDISGKALENQFNRDTYSMRMHNMRLINDKLGKEIDVLVEEKELTHQQGYYVKRQCYAFNMQIAAGMPTWQAYDIENRAYGGYVAYQSARQLYYFTSEMNEWQRTNAPWEHVNTVITPFNEVARTAIAAYGVSGAKGSGNAIQWQVNPWSGQLGGFMNAVNQGSSYPGLYH